MSKISILILSILIQSTKKSGSEVDQSFLKFLMWEYLRKYIYNFFFKYIYLSTRNISWSSFIFRGNQNNRFCFISSDIPMISLHTFTINITALLTDIRAFVHYLPLSLVARATLINTYNLSVYTVVFL